MKKFKFRVVFLRKVNSIYCISKVVTFKNTSNESYTILDKTLVINYSKPAYMKKNIFLYFIDLDGSQLDYSKTNSNIDPKFLKIIAKANIMSQISKSLTDDIKHTNYTLAIISLVIGVLMGIMGYNMYLNAKGLI